MYIPQDFSNNYAQYCLDLLPIWLYVNKDSLSEYTRKFYKNLFISAETSNYFHDIVDYISDKSREEFENFSIYCLDTGDTLQLTLTFNEEIMNYIMFEYIMHEIMDYNLKVNNCLAADLVYELTEDDGIFEAIFISYKELDNITFDCQDTFFPWILNFDTNKTIEELYTLDKELSNRFLEFRLSAYHRLIPPVDVLKIIGGKI